MALVIRQTTVGVLIEVHPETRTVFAIHGMGCAACMGAPDETVESSARMHGISVERLLNELNDVIERQREEEKSG